MWNQIYDPLHSPVLSTIAAAVPVVTLLVLIASGRVKAHIAAVIAVIITNLITIFVFTMPAGMSIRASMLGIVTGFFPIGWIVLNVIFLYQVTVSTGRFELLKRAIGGVTEDRRLQLLLVAFSFGAFFEGASGFGTPVATVSRYMKMTLRTIQPIGKKPVTAPSAVARSDMPAGMVKMTIATRFAAMSAMIAAMCACTRPLAISTSKVTTGIAAAMVESTGL